MTSAWDPLERPLFRALWIATVVSNIGTWMHEVGAGWLMVTLDPRPIMVSLVQAATALPIFFLALPAGALADILDRRRYLIATQVWMLAAAALLGMLTLAGLTTAWMLLGFTFALGIGAAMMTPAWAATLPELVPREELQPAVTLNSIAINLSRAIGPAIAGVVVTAAGSGAAFVLNALSFLGVIAVLARWQRAPATSTLPAERFFGAMRAGLRYVRQAGELQAVMLRALAFFVFATALWALLPLTAQRIGGGAGVYGTLLACLGAG
ncbi:MAG: MFS transporter, partial [Betaproteobacteria bacterium]|nr:MFS transporter [Betaproteobacteria bacterium]